MAMPATQIRRGMVLVFEGDPCRIIEFRHHTPGNLRAMVQAKLKNLRTGNSFEHRFRAADSIEMCRVLFGADFVDRNCVILGNVNTNSPLVLDGEASRVIRTYARANQAAVCVPFILGGAMGPVTTAGALAQCFAEAMMCVALTQLERPGAPAPCRAIRVRARCRGWPAR